MYDRINPPDNVFTRDEMNYCDRCHTITHEADIRMVWISPFVEKEWCPSCVEHHSAIHPILNEQWAIGAVDTESNNLIIK